MLIKENIVKKQRNGETPRTAKKWILQFISFGIVGASNTVISFGVYYLLLWLHVDYRIASTAGFLLSVANAWFWSSHFVFRPRAGGGHTHKKNTIMKIYGAYGVTYLLNMGLLMWLVSIGVSKLIAPILILFVTMPLNFLFNKFWVFR